MIKEKTLYGIYKTDGTKIYFTSLDKLEKYVAKRIPRTLTKTYETSEGNKIKIKLKFREYTINMDRYYSEGIYFKYDIKQVIDMDNNCIVNDLYFYNGNNFCGFKKQEFNKNGELELKDLFFETNDLSIKPMEEYERMQEVTIVIFINTKTFYIKEVE